MSGDQHYGDPRCAHCGGHHPIGAVCPAAPPPAKPRFDYLSVTEDFNLNMACRIIKEAFATPFQVGSSLHRPNYRDVDVRCILVDSEFDQLTGYSSVRLKLLNVAMSEWLAARTGLPIDFQFQRMTDANKEFGGPRNALGMAPEHLYTEAH